MLQLQRIDYRIIQLFCTRTFLYISEFVKYLVRNKTVLEYPYTICMYLYIMKPNWMINNISTIKINNVLSALFGYKVFFFIRVIISHTYVHRKTVLHFCKPLIFDPCRLPTVLEEHKIMFSRKRGSTPNTNLSSWNKD